MKKLIFLGVLVAGVGAVLSTPQGRKFVKKYADEFNRNYHEHEEKLYDVFAPVEQSVEEVNTRMKYTD
ncbi:hypothetical protein HCQ94_02600 [Actinomyces sp. zg-332]|uniref:hypothetical protein n=1 Tax=Actinomyces sp. zg-332 TaxID=2708340 RepID=UPI0014218403|nr:hypothetical protein [Actinomyces sp. zg-332]QPK94606.1 hypothetical protein HCQ94_02600 [Actinomyces sp. zg-332]